MTYFKPSGYHGLTHRRFGASYNDYFYVLKHERNGFLKGLNPDILFTLNPAYSIRFSSLADARKFMAVEGLNGFSVKRVEIVGRGSYEIMDR